MIPNLPSGHASAKCIAFTAQFTLDIRCKIQKQLWILRPLRDLPNGLIWFSIMWIWPKRLNASREINENSTDDNSFLPQRPPKGRLAFPGPFSCGRPQGPWVPRQNQLVLCGQKGRWRKYYGLSCSYK